jgi:hypothetical protein
VSLNLPPGVTGDVGLALRVPHPLKGGKPLRFANRGATPSQNGELVLGKMSVR